MSVIRILVVEDFEPFRRLVRLDLEQRPEFQIIGEVADGLEAVQKAKELQPDLVLMDIGLPTMNGIEAARRIRAVAPPAKLLFLSMESSSSIVRETFSLGALGYVEKLRAKIDLLPAIDAVLAGRKFVSSGLEFSESREARRRHDVQFYSDDVVFIETATAFIVTALNANNPVIVLATRSHREGLVERLGNIRRLPIELETDLFRVIQEGLTNVIRHSGSEIAIIRLAKKENSVLVQIEDRGRGLKIEAAEQSESTGFGVGIPSMRERLRQHAATLEISSGIQGTTLTVLVPVTPGGQAMKTSEKSAGKP